MVPPAVEPRLGSRDAAVTSGEHGGSDRPATGQPSSDRQLESPRTSTRANVESAALADGPFAVATTLGVGSVAGASEVFVGAGVEYVGFCALHAVTTHAS